MEFHIREAHLNGSLPYLRKSESSYTSPNRYPCRRTLPCFGTTVLGPPEDSVKTGSSSRGLTVWRGSHPAPFPTRRSCPLLAACREHDYGRIDCVPDAPKYFEPIKAARKHDVEHRDVVFSPPPAFPLPFRRRKPHRSRILSVRDTRSEACITPGRRQLQVFVSSNIPVGFSGTIELQSDPCREERITRIGRKGGRACALRTV